MATSDDHHMGVSTKTLAEADGDEIRLETPIAVHTYRVVGPKPASHLALSPEQLAQLFGVYALGLVPGLLLGGPLSDRFGRRPVIGGGIALLLLACALAGIRGLWRLDAAVRAFARRGYVVFNINYSLAPASPYPAAIEDACAQRSRLDRAGSKRAGRVAMIASMPRVSSPLFVGRAAELERLAWELRIVEREATGGQAGQSSRIENYLGFPAGITGSELTSRAGVMPLNTYNDAVGPMARSVKGAFTEILGMSSRSGRDLDGRHHRLRADEAAAGEEGPRGQGARRARATRSHSRSPWPRSPMRARSGHRLPTPPAPGR